MASVQSHIGIPSTDAAATVPEAPVDTMAVLAASAVRRSRMLQTSKYLRLTSTGVTGCHQKGRVNYVTHPELSGRGFPTAAWVGHKYPDGASAAAGMIVR